MKNVWYLAIALLPIVFISGCVGSNGVFSAFNFISGEKEEIVAPNDVLLIDKVNVIPDPPIYADTPFTVNFQVMNVGKVSEGDKEARNVKATLYDWGLCHPTDKNGNELKLDYTSQVIGLENKTIYPGGAELVEFYLKAPTNEELSRMENRCPLRFKVEYEFDAYTTSDLIVVSRERIVEASRSGETIHVTPLKTQSRGPLKIDIDFDTTQPVSSEIIVPTIIKVEDKGSGMYEKIPPGSLILKFPAGIEVLKEGTSFCQPSGWFESVDEALDRIRDTLPESKLKEFMSKIHSPYEGTVLINTKEIPLIKGETPVIRCSLRVTDEVKNIKTFTIMGEIKNYVYPLYHEEYVTVKPTYVEE